MQKKLLAVAVAGALGAPAVALAQNATVSVYGRLYAEYSLVSQGANHASGTAPVPPATGDLARVDFMQTPGSAIGFRGEEKLGGGNSVWFQCESSMDYRGNATGAGSDGWCTRNSALGLKGGWGNLFHGNWDTPFNRVGSMSNVGSNQTGVFGNGQLLFGQVTTTNSGAASGGTFLRRQRNVVIYESPNFGGFQLSGAYTYTNADTATASSATGVKARLTSFSGTYRNGPLDLGLGYEKHKDVTGAAAARSEDGWVFGGAYRFANNLRLGGTYTRQKFERGTAAAPTEGKVTAWHVGMDWMITGPHGIRAAYTRANDMKSNQVAPFGGIGGGAVAVVGGIPVVAAGTGFGPPYRPACNAVTACSNTGATLYQIRYVYQMSKRTEFTAGYSKMDNKGAAAYQLYGLSSNNLGRDQSAIAIALDHRF